MIKHIVTMDKDDFTTIDSVMSRLRVNANKLPDTYTKSEIQRCISEIEDILGIEPPPIPEAATAKWSIWYNAMFHSSTLTCSNCGYKHDIAINASDSPSRIPTVCPNCKAVMTGVE